MVANSNARMVGGEHSGRPQQRSRSEPEDFIETGISTKSLRLRHPLEHSLRLVTFDADSWSCSAFPKHFVRLRALPLRLSQPIYSAFDSELGIFDDRFHFATTQSRASKVRSG